MWLCYCGKDDGFVIEGMGGQDVEGIDGETRSLELW